MNFDEELSSDKPIAEDEKVPNSSEDIELIPTTQQDDYARAIRLAPSTGSTIESSQAHLLEARARLAVTRALLSASADVIIPLHDGHVLPLLQYLVLSKSTNETWLSFQVRIYYSIERNPLMILININQHCRSK